MQRFTKEGAGLYASQGGPIILSQIENEYGNIDAAGKAYMRWSAGMAVSLDTGVPWVMCQQNRRSLDVQCRLQPSLPLHG
jgi:hypothetical protein